MGLLEKALQYKKEMNSRGKETLIDKIQGPAETELMTELMFDEIPSYTPPEDARERHAGGVADVAPKNVQKLDGIGDDLFELPIDIDDEPVINADRQQESTDPHVDALATDDLHIIADDMAPHEDTISAEETIFGPEDEPVLPPRKPPVQAQGDDDNEVMSGSEHSISETSTAHAEVAVPEQSSPVSEAVTASEESMPSDVADDTRVRVADDEKGVVSRQSKKFHDFMVLYEISKEIVKAETRKSLYDVMLFSIMGQIGASSSSIMVPDPDDDDKWYIADFRGISLKNNRLRFDHASGILSRLHASKTILDLDEFKDVSELRDEYYKFISIDTRLIAPLLYNGKILGAILLGEKITIGDYTEPEKDFIVSICEISAIALNNVNAMEDLRGKAEKRRHEAGLYEAIDNFSSDFIRTADDTRMKERAVKAVSEAGGLRCAVYVFNEKEDVFEPWAAGGPDDMVRELMNTRIALDNPFAGRLNEAKREVFFDSARDCEYISDAFEESIISGMSVVWLFPFITGDLLRGFTAVFDIDDPMNISDIQFQIKRITRIVFEHLYAVKNLALSDTRYGDSIEPVLRRIQSSLENAGNLKIPLTLVMFSIKNLKRYFALYGENDAKRLIDACDRIISERLADTDYAVRFDRNKILLVLPGKNKKFAVPLANTIRNEITVQFKKKEMQLMLVYLSAEFPEDGEDLYSLLDAIE